MGGCAVDWLVFLFLLAIETECIQMVSESSWYVAAWRETEWTKRYYLGGHKKV